MAWGELPHPIRINILQVDGQTKREVTILGQQAGIDALIEHAVAARNLGVIARILGNSEHVRRFCPNGKAKQPIPFDGHFI